MAVPLGRSYHRASPPRPILSGRRRRGRKRLAHNKNLATGRCCCTTGTAFWRPTSLPSNRSTRGSQVDQARCTCRGRRQGETEQHHHRSHLSPAALARHQVANEMAISFPQRATGCGVACFPPRYDFSMGRETGRRQGEQTSSRHHYHKSTTTHTRLPPSYQFICSCTNQATQHQHHCTVPVIGQKTPVVASETSTPTPSICTIPPRTHRRH